MVTADSTVCGFAPMYTLLTITCGGARLGNCAMGSVGIVIAPPKIISSAQTVANTGRRMKKSTKYHLVFHHVGTPISGLALESSVAGHGCRLLHLLHHWH